MLRIDQARDLPRPPWEITLAQALPKGKLFESIIQKATELGVYRIVPLLSERVVTQVDDAGAAHKGEKWRQVAIEAIKQCGSGWLPQIETPTTPGEFANCPMQFDLDLVAALQPGSEHLRAHLVKFSSREGRPPRSVRVWVGPEGDFTAAEYDLIQRGGALPITLGHLVLRVETAAIYSLAIVNHELQAAHAFIPGAQFVPSGKS
jgi:16S rRNA (uracil1498-N3)-methyltransferase